MKEKICVVLIGLLLVAGCIGVFALMPKEVSRHEFTTNVTITDTYHRAAYRTPVKSGKTTTYIYHSAQWKVYVEYGGEEYSINDRDTYNYCDDREGEIVQAVMARITYDNDTVDYRLISIVGVE